MVTLGDLHGSPNRNLSAVNVILSQKLFVISTLAMNSGMAMRLPPTQIHALSMGLPFPNLSAIMPPDMELANPQTKLITE
jgi:hypothetical protein